MSRERWRVGGKVKLNVYRDDAPMFMCHTPQQAAEVVALLNLGEQASTDTERLDAFSLNKWGMYIEREEGGSLLFTVCDVNACDVGSGQTPREAIDAARGSGE